MDISGRAGAWGRVRVEQHGGAVRRGEGQFIPSVLGVTPKCFRCKGQKKVQECFIVKEEMDWMSWRRMTRTTTETVSYLQQEVIIISRLDFCNNKHNYYKIQIIRI